MRFWGMWALLCAVCWLAGCAQAPKQSYGEGELAYAQGNYAIAETIFRPYANNAGPKRIEALYYYGMCQAHLGEVDKADKTLQRAIGFCEDRALRARIMAGRAEIALKRGRTEDADAIFEELRLHYYDVISPEALAKGRSSTVFTNPLQAELVTVPASAATKVLHRVRLTNTFGNKADALAESYRLQDAGIEATVVPLPKKLFAVQIGAFYNLRLAEARVTQATRLGWTAVIVH